MQYPSRAVADLMRWATKHGCTYGGVAQSGHVKILLPNGETYRTGASPSDMNVVKIARREIAKKLGIHEKRPRSGRYKHEPQQAARQPAAVRVDSVSAQYAAHAKRHRELCDTIIDAKTACDIDTARTALRELVDVEIAISGLGRRPPLRTFRV